MCFDTMCVGEVQIWILLCYICTLWKIKNDSIEHLFSLMLVKPDPDLCLGNVPKEIFRLTETQPVLTRLCYINFHPGPTQFSLNPLSNKDLFYLKNLTDRQRNTSGALCATPPNRGAGEVETAHSEEIVIITHSCRNMKNKLGILD